MKSKNAYLIKIEQLYKYYDIFNEKISPRKNPYRFFGSAKFREFENDGHFFEVKYVHIIKLKIKLRKKCPEWNLFSQGGCILM